MKYHVISDQLSELLKGQRIEAAFFTTFSFEPDFFELEIMPLLNNLPENKRDGAPLSPPALSTDDAVRWAQLQHLLIRKPLPTTVVYDPDIYVPERSPRLDVAYRAWSPAGNGCQHAKLIVVLYRCPDTDTQHLLFGAGSFNLTRAGWWDNIECGHFITLTQGDAPQNLAASITRALNFYAEQIGMTPGLEEILAYLGALETTAEQSDIQFYFGYSGDSKTGPFHAFIKEHCQSPASMEVISPYFAQDGENSLLASFMAQMGTTRLLLPLDPRTKGQVRIDKSRYTALKDTPNVGWHSMAGQTEERLAQGAVDQPRQLHAKVYNIHHNDGQQLLFVGSVNFSVQAFLHNTEAGFLLRGTKYEPLLSEAVAAEPETYEQEDETRYGDGDRSGGLAIVNLEFDWDCSRLSVTGAPLQDQPEIVLCCRSGRELARIPVDGAEPVISDMDALRAELSRSSLLNAHSAAEPSLQADYLISQRNLFKRPGELKLSLADLLSIYRGMKEPALLSLIDRYASQIRGFKESADNQGVSTAIPERGFFSEFSEINSAFYRLEQTLRKAAEEDPQQLKYYLQGEQPDSLKTLLATLNQPAADGVPQDSAVSRYLTLLSIREIYLLYPGFAESGIREEIDSAILALEQGSEFNFSEGWTVEPAEFFDWFKREFATH